MIKTIIGIAIAFAATSAFATYCPDGSPWPKNANGSWKLNADGSHYCPPVNPPPTPVTPVITQTGTLTQSGTIEQSATQKLTGKIEQKAITNSGDITNLAKGGNAVIEKGAIQTGAQTNTLSIEKGALSPTATASATVAPGAVVNNVDSQGGSVKDSGNSTIEKGAIEISIDASRHEAPQPKAVATTPTPMQVNPVAPTSFYPIGSPNAVGAAGFVTLYEAFCPTQMSGDNLVRSGDKYVKYIASLDDQARMSGSTRTPEVRIVQSQTAAKGRCICLGTLQVESVITPDEARDNNMQSVHASAGKWVRENLRGFNLVQLVYSPAQSLTFQKGTAAYASSRGIGGGGSATFGSSGVAMITPSWGSTNGYSTDYPIVGVTYALIATVDGTEAPAGSRTLDVGVFMQELAKMPAPQTWGSTQSSPLAQAATVK